MFRGAELTRLLTSIVFLVVLGMLIVQARNPLYWRWLCREPAVGGPADPATSIHDRPADDPANAAPNHWYSKKAAAAAAKKKAAGAVASNAAKPAGAVRPASTASPRANGKTLHLPPLPTGPTDLDEEEREGAREEFQAVTDRTFEMHPEEMNAYWRLFSWAQNQSVAGLSKRAVKDVVYNDFIQTPDDFRGRLVALDLNVRRVLRGPATRNRVGIKNVYEVVGFTTESQAWLYFCLAADLPKGMPVGSTVEENATFYGYFLKLQDYYRAGASPDEKPLTAPVLIGRLVWHSAAAAEARGETFSQFFWAAIMGAGLLVAGGIWLVVRMGGKSSGNAGRVLPVPAVPMDQWLEGAEEGTLEVDGAEPDSADADDPQHGDGYFGGRLGGYRTAGKPGGSSGGNGFSNGR
jgi:hypothetical protein